MSKKSKIDKMLEKSRKIVKRHREDLEIMRKGIIRKIAIDVLLLGRCTQDETLDLIELRFIYDMVKILSRCQEDLSKL